MGSFGINSEWLLLRSLTLIPNGLQGLKSHFADCGKRNKHLLPPETGPSAIFLSAPHAESRTPAGLSGFAHFPPAVQSLLLILSQVSHCWREKKKRQKTNFISGTHSGNVWLNEKETPIFSEGGGSSKKLHPNNYIQSINSHFFNCSFISSC